MKALIFAAGLGTRLKPLTDNTPKALVKVAGKPMLQLTIERLKKQGITEFVVNIHHFGNQIIEFLKTHNNFDCNIHISDEREKLLDTGGGLKKTQKYLEAESYFLIHNADILSEISMAEMEKAHKQKNALATLAVQDREASRKLGFTESGQLAAWKNFKTGETILTRKYDNLKYLAFSGIHIVSSEIFDLLPPDDKYPIIPEYLNMAKTQNIIAFQHNEPLFDMGTSERIAQAEKFFRN